MNVKSMFEFKFSEAAREEGLHIVEAIGHDMVTLDGYLDHEVIQDVKDAGHLMVNTRWGNNQQADAVLSVYMHDPKIKRATELLGAPPVGFVGGVLPTSA